MTTPELDVLAQRAKAGDRAALESLVGGLEAPLYRLALRFLHDREHARDATQEILVLVVTKLGGFRGDSAVATWAHRVACRHLLRARSRLRKLTFASMVEEDLAQPPNAIEPATLAGADARLLEEEVFLGCTQAMLQALDRNLRIAFVLGALCELSAAEAAYALGITAAAFRKRLSRARATLDAFLAAHCGVADANNACRCAFQVNHAVRKGRLDPKALRHVGQPVSTSLETLRAHGEIARVRQALAVYQVQPQAWPPEALAAEVRSAIGAMRVFDA